MCANNYILFTHLSEILPFENINFHYVHIVILFYEIKQVKKSYSEEPVLPALGRRGVERNGLRQGPGAPQPLAEEIT